MAGPRLTPVDYDPFAPAQGHNRYRLTPVDFDPFARRQTPEDLSNEAYHRDIPVDEINAAGARSDYNRRRRELEATVERGRPERYVSAGRGGAEESEMEFAARRAAATQAQREIDTTSADDPLGISHRLDPNEQRRFTALTSHMPSTDDPRRFPGLYRNVPVPNGLQRGVVYGDRDPAGYQRLSQREITDTIIAHINDPHVRDLPPDAAVAYLFGGAATRAQIDRAQRGAFGDTTERDALFHAGDPSTDEPVDPYGTGDDSIRGSAEAPRMSPERAARGAEMRDVQRRMGAGPFTDVVSPGDIDEIPALVDYSPHAAEERQIERNVAAIRRQRTREGYYNGFGGWIRGLGEAGMATLHTTAGAVVDSVVSSLGGEDTELARRARQMSRYGRSEMELADPGYQDGSLPYYLFHGGVAIEQMAGAFAVGAVTRNPATTTSAVMGVQVAAQEYDDLRQQGWSPRAALGVGLLYGLAEAIPEKVALGEILHGSQQFGRSLARRVIVGGARAAAIEGLQEDFTELLQMGIDTGIVGQDMTWGDAWRRLRDSGIIGSMTGAPIGSIHEGVAGSRRAARRAFEEPIREGTFDPAQIDQEARDAFKPTNLTEQDIASPLPNDLIARGKARVEEIERGGGRTVRQQPSRSRTASPPPTVVGPSTPFSAVREHIIANEVGSRFGGYDALAYNTSPTHNAAGVVPPRPITQMTIGEVYDFQRGPMRARTRGRRGQGDVGSTGAGAYQFESETLRQNAEMTFGANWRNQPFTPQNQDRIAETLWNRVRANPQLRANTWAAFGPNARTGGSVPDSTVDMPATPEEQANTDWITAPVDQPESAAQPAPASETRLPEPETVEVDGRPATVQERFDLNGEPGARLQLEDGTTVEDTVARLAARGIRISDGSREMPIQVTRSADIEHAAARAAQPTEAQAEAGNYRAGHIRLHGIDITIETPRGAERSGTGPDGERWSVTMPDHYGYAKRTTGADEEQVDVYVGPQPESGRVFVVDQKDADTGQFDEHKAMLGYQDEAAARAAYEQAFSDGRAAERIGGVTEMSVDQFKGWLGTPQTEPVSDVAGVTQNQRNARFNPDDHLPALRSYVENRRNSLDMKAIGKALGINAKQAGRVAATLVSRPGSGLTISRKGNLRRASVARGPVSAIRFLRDNGGIRDDAGHDLIKGRNWHLAAPGLIQRNGRSIDEAGELLHEAGYFHNRDENDRPTEAEVLDFIEGAMKTPAYRQEDLAEAQAREAKKEGKSAQANAEYAVRDLAENLELNLAAEELSDAVEYMAAGDSAEIALQRALNDASAKALDEIADDTGRDFYSTVAETIYEGDIAEPRGGDEGADTSGVGPEGVTSEPREREAPGGKPAEDGGQGVAALAEQARKASATRQGSTYLADKTSRNTLAWIEGFKSGYAGEAQPDVGGMGEGVRSDGWHTGKWVRETGKPVLTQKELKEPLKETTRPPAVSRPPAVTPAVQMLSEMGPFADVTVDAKRAGDDIIDLDGIRSKKRGAGTAAMHEIVALADKHGVTLQVYAKSMGDVPTDKLAEWYGRFGFENMTGRVPTKEEMLDPEHDGVDMVREPVEVSQTDLLGNPVEQKKPTGTEKPAQPETPDMFGTREGDERRALEREAEGRKKSDAKQKAAGEDGGLFDTRNTTRDLLHPDQEPMTQDEIDAIKAMYVDPRFDTEAEAQARADDLNAKNPGRYWRVMPVGITGKFVAVETKAPVEKPADTPVEQAKAALQNALDLLNGKPTGEMIQDAGEKIGGARKDRWAERGMNTSDLEGMSQGEAFQLVNKDAVWPKPDYAKMVEGGVAPEAAAGIKILRDSLAAKPREDSDEGRRNYIEMMGAARDILASVKTMADLEGVQQRLWDAAGMPRERGMVASSSEEAKAARKKLFSIAKGNRFGFSISYSERSKIKKMIAEGFPAKAEPWTRRYVVREWDRSETPWQVRTKAGRRASEERFATKAEAEAAAKAIYESEDRTRDKAPERPHLDRIERSGEDVRGGRDIDSTDFLTDFGFRGVEYGNWVASDERQKSTNLAYEALHDLASTLGIPPRALSLGGQLALAFGARGKGRAAAHYEPGKLVINLTKMSGAGSLAHEWGHAFDHYFGSLDTDLGTRGAPKGASGWMDYTPSRLVALGNLRPEMAAAFDNLMSTIFKRDRTRADQVLALEQAIEKTQAGIEQQKERVAKTKEQMASAPSDFSKREYQRFIKRSEEWIAERERHLAWQNERLAEAKDETKPIRATQVDTDFAAKSAKLPGKQGGKPYWTQPTEMLARSFEAYVFDKIASAEKVSQYLVQGVEEAGDFAQAAYPTGAERQAINAAYDRLFSTMDVREQDGEQMLFQKRLTEGDDPIFYSALERAVESSPTTRASADQWAATLSKAAGVKKEELEWTGLFDWLDMQKGPVSRDDLLGVIRDGGIQVEEHVLGGKETPVTDQQIEERARAISELVEGDDSNFDAYLDQAQADLEAEDTPSETQFGSWSSDPDNAGYRELLITLPIAQGGNPTRDFQTHWEQEAVIAHTRFMPKTDADGSRVLFIEEIQSDRAQAGRDRGFEKKLSEEEMAAADKALNEADDKMRAADKALVDEALRLGIAEPSDLDQIPYPDGLSPDLIHRAKRAILERADTTRNEEEDSRLRGLLRDAQEAALRVNEAMQAASRRESGGVPDMPFKSSWPALLIKRMIRWAVDNGYDKIAWTTGEEQADRYSLGEHVGNLDVMRDGDQYLVRLDRTRAMDIIVENGMATTHEATGRLAMTKEQLKAAFGADIAQRVVEATETKNLAIISSGDLRVGGEGMRGFYDRNLVNIANDLIKKYGGKVERVGLHEDADHMAEKIAFNERQLEKLKRGELPRRNDMTLEETIALAEQQLAAMKQGNPHPGFAITPELADAARSGFPLFARQQAMRAAPSESQVREIAERLGKELARLGIDDRIALRVGNGILKHVGDGSAQGAYFRRVIQVATDMSLNPEATLNHEAIHAIRALGLFNDSEWSALVKQATGDASLMKQINANYQGLSLDKRQEEAVAEFYSRWRTERAQAKGFAAKAFQRLLDFIHALGRVIGAVRGKPLGAGTVMRRIESGKVGRRETGAGQATMAPQFQSGEDGFDFDPAQPQRGMTERQRAEMEARLKQSKIGRLGQKSLGDQQGGMFDAERDQGMLFQAGDPISFDSEESEKRWQDARKGVGGGASIITKGKAAWENVVAGMTRHWKYLPNSARFVNVREQFRKLEAAPEFAKEETVRHLNSVVGKLTKNEYDLFTRKVVLDDLDFEAGREHQLPFGLTPATLTAERAKVDAAVAASPKIQEAIAKRLERNRKIADEMVKEGILTEEQTSNPAYFRHMVLDYARAERQMARGAGSKVMSPWWAKRAGSSLDINANFLEAEADWMLKAMVDIETAKTIRHIKESDHNIRETLRKQARDSNKQGVDEAIARSPDLAAEEKEFRKRVAMGLDDVRKAVESGDLDVPAQFAAAAASLSTKGTRDESIFPLLSWIMENGKPGMRGAAMALKAISNRRAWAREILGKRYLDPENIAQLVERLGPEGYVGWQPREGKHLFTAKTIPEHVIDRLVNRLADQSAFGISKDEMARALDSIKPQLVTGGDRYTMVIPKEIADTLDEFGDVHAEGMLAKIFGGVQSAWKRWVLINPRRFFKYNLNNQVGDLDAVIAGHPATMRKVRQAASELYQVLAKSGEPSAAYREAQERGVFSSGLTLQEIPDINRLSSLKHLTTDMRSNRPDKLLARGVGKVWRALQDSTAFRESVFRYAAYLSLKEKMDAGQSLAQIGYGASVPKLIEAVDDNADRAALMARDLLGDYGAISVVGGWLRKYMIPFWSWMEINTRRYTRLFANVYRTSRAKGASRTGAAAATAFSYSSASLVVRMGMVYALIQLWNHLLFPDEEDDLNDLQKRQLHLIVGRDSNGEVISLRTQGALSDFLGTFGFEDALAAFRRASVGQGDYSDALGAVAKAPVNRVATSVTPLLGEPIEQMLGLELWPDAFNPRPIRDRIRHLASTLSLENEYDAVADRPSRGYWRSWADSIVYRRDPGEMAYDDIRGVAADFLERTRGESGSVNRRSPKSDALRDYRQALRFGDQEAAQEALERYRQYDGTRRGLQASLRAAAPLGMIPRRLRSQFRQSLTEDQLENLREAQDWFDSQFLNAGQ